MSRPTYLNIDLSALKHNLNKVKTFAKKSRIIAMVKANAYGHGLVRIASALTEADALGVASVEEGIKLRESGITLPILLMEGLFYQDEVFEAQRYDFTLIVHHEPHLEILEKYQGEHSFKVWLKINTGMNRLGIMPNEVKNFFTRLNSLRCIKKPIGLMTHFAQADSEDKTFTAMQIKNFFAASLGLDGPLSLANSAAILNCPESHCDYVRPGLLLYGASPFKNQAAINHGLLPVMTLRSRLIAINDVKAGNQVGYGGAWRAPEDMRVGVVGVGYGDGYPQFAENGTPVLVNNEFCPLVGRVSMDMLTVDLRNLNRASIGDSVVLWGSGLPIEYVAEKCKSSVYEILTRMTPRPKIEVRE